MSLLKQDLVTSDRVEPAGVLSIVCSKRYVVYMQYM